MSSNAAAPAPLLALFSVSCLAAASTVLALHSLGKGGAGSSSSSEGEDGRKRQLDAEEKAREYRRKIEGE